MMVVTAIGLSLSTVLTAIGLIHVFWALGGVWPGTDERSLARSVVGAKGIGHMPPPGLALVVAALLFGAALVPLTWLDFILGFVPERFTAVALLALGLVFAVRGIAGYTPWFRTSNPEEPFATLDKRFYSPLCLALSAGFATLLLTGV